MYNFLVSSSPVLIGYKAVFGKPGPKDDPPSVLPSIIFFGTCLTITRFLWEHFVLIPNGWQTATVDKERECLGGLVALTHSSLLLGPLLGLLMTHPTMKPSARFADSPASWNYNAKTLISFTTSYMFQDAFWMLYYATDTSKSPFPAPTPDNAMFLLHHLATVLYMSSCRYIEAGHYSAMWLMWLGEVTNPVHNSYLLLEYAEVSHPGPNITMLLYYFSKAFAVSYGVLRIFIGPAAGLYIVYDLLLTPAGRKNVGLVLGIIWAVLIEEVLKGSFYYAFDVAIKAW
ncbi:hypothetical protein TrST_g13338 [Triparma strigata]|uniref:TLC domain-containing protein n=1 Tax=Triparma strigata TaxID=1606541 RepID=A0A9W7BKT4_9STRA|nr:hypothetical protein TrST_g13338 [Triparma strigata]